MEKISGILPSSARVTGVNTAELSPVRPGAPGFGRPQGSSAITDKVTRSSIDRQSFDSNPLNYTRPRDLAHRKIADRVTQQFFDTQAGRAEEVRVPEVADSPVEAIDDFMAPSDLPEEFHLEPTEGFLIAQREA